MTTLKTRKWSPKKRKKIARLKGDFSYWARNCYKIRDKYRRLVPLRLNRVQRKLEVIEHRLRERHGRVRIYVLKGRQGGITTYEQARSLHLVWKKRGAVCFTLADVVGNMTKIFEITHRAIEHFPPSYIWRLADASKQEISFADGRDSFFWTGTAGSKRTGHSVTVDRVHGSEFAFWTDPADVLGTITPAVVPDGAIVLETTADRFESAAHDYWKKAVSGESGYEPVFFPWWDCDWENYQKPLLEPDELDPITDDESRLMLTHSLTPPHIAWRRMMMKELGISEFLRQFAEDPESCWLAAGDGFYNADTLRVLYHRAPQPFTEIDVVHGEWSGQVRLYEEELWDVSGGTCRYIGGERVVIGCDPAEGTGNDRTAWVARTFPSWKLIAEFGDSYIYPEYNADLLNDWGTNKLWFQSGKVRVPAHVIVEKNGHGITTLRRMRDVHQYPSECLYRRLRLADRHAPRQPSLGWATSAESKPLLLDAGRSIFNAALDGQIGVPSEHTIRDAFAVVQDENGKVELNSRDQLVSEMLAWMAREDIVKRTPPKLATLHR